MKSSMNYEIQSMRGITQKYITKVRIVKIFSSCNTKNYFLLIIVTNTFADAGKAFLRFPFIALLMLLMFVDISQLNYRWNCS